MSLRANIVLEFKAKGQSDVKAAMNGITSEVRKQDAALKRSNAIAIADAKARGRVTLETAKQSNRLQLADVKKTAKAEADARASAEQRKREDHRRTAQLAAESFRLQAREHAAMLRAQQRAQQDARRSLGRIPTVAAAVVTAGVAVGRHAQGVLGVRSQEDIIRSSVELRQEAIRQMAPLGLDAGRRESMLRQQIDIGREMGVSAEQMIDGLAFAQEQFSSLGHALQRGEAGVDEFFGSMRFFARVQRASGADLRDVVATAGVLERQLHLSPEQVREGLGRIFQGSQEGSLSFRDFANTMPQALAPYITARGSSSNGMQTLQEFQAVGQALRAGDVAPEQARTMTEAFMTAMSERHTQRALHAAGVDVLDRRGNVRDPAEIVAEIARNPRLRTSSQVRRAFGRREASDALSIMVNQEQAASAGVTGALSLRQRENMDARAGLNAIDATYRAVNTDASGRAIRLGTDREARIMGNSAEMIDAYRNIAEGLTELEDEFPMLTAAVSALTPVVAAVLPWLAVLASRNGGGGGLFSGGGRLAGLLGGGGGAAGASGGGLMGVLAGAAAIGVPAGLLHWLVTSDSKAAQFLGEMGSNNEGLHNARAVMRGETEQRMHDFALGGPIVPGAGGTQAADAQGAQIGGFVAAQAMEQQTRALVQELRGVRSAIEHNRPAPNNGPLLLEGERGSPR